MRFEDIRIGSRLRVRQWDDMAREYRRDCDDEIPCRFTFVKEMRYMCGREFTVARIDDCIGYIKSEEKMEEEDCPLTRGFWHVSADMLEPLVEEAEIEDGAVFDRDDLYDFLYAGT